MQDKKIQRKTANLSNSASFFKNISNKRTSRPISFSLPISNTLKFLMLITFFKGVECGLYNFVSSDRHYAFGTEEDISYSYYVDLLNDFKNNITAQLENNACGSITKTSLVPTDTTSVWRRSLCNYAFELVRSSEESAYELFENCFKAIANENYELYDAKCQEQKDAMNERDKIILGVIFGVVGFVLLSMIGAFLCQFGMGSCQRRQYATIPDKKEDEENIIKRITKEKLNPTVKNDNEAEHIELPTSKLF